MLNHCLQGCKSLQRRAQPVGWLFISRLGCGSGSSCRQGPCACPPAPRPPRPSAHPPLPRRSLLQSRFSLAQAWPVGCPGLVTQRQLRRSGPCPGRWACSPGGQLSRIFSSLLPGRLLTSLPTQGPRPTPTRAGPEQETDWLEGFHRPSAPGGPCTSASCHLLGRRPGPRRSGGGWVPHPHCSWGRAAAGPAFSTPSSES